MIARLLFAVVLLLPTLAAAPVDAHAQDVKRLRALRDAAHDIRAAYRDPAPAAPAGGTPRVAAAARIARLGGGEIG